MIPINDDQTSIARRRKSNQPSVLADATRGAIAAKELGTRLVRHLSALPRIRSIADGAQALIVAMMRTIVITIATTMQSASSRISQSLIKIPIEDAAVWARAPRLASLSTKQTSL